MHLGICKIRSYRDTVYCTVSLYERILHIPRLHIREPVQQKLETKWARIRLSGNINKTTRKSNCLPFLNNELGISRPIDFSVKVISYLRIVNHSAVRVFWTKCTVCLHVSPLSPISYDNIVLSFINISQNRGGLWNMYWMYTVIYKIDTAVYGPVAELLAT